MSTYRCVFILCERVYYVLKICFSPQRYQMHVYSSCGTTYQPWLCCITRPRQNTPYRC